MSTFSLSALDLGSLSAKFPGFESAIAAVKSLLQGVAQDRVQFYRIFEQSFGNDLKPDVAEAIRGKWANGDFREIPAIVVVEDGLGIGVSGAYASSTNTIYLAQDFVTTALPKALRSVLLEEIGHFTDVQVKEVDSSGDEGAIFAALVQGDNLDVAVLQAEDDHGIIMVNGNAIQVEQQNFLGTSGDDFIEGTTDNDTLDGGDGNDRLSGGEGDDVLNGDAGDDLLEGAEGNDFLDAGDGNDLLQGGGGDDSLFDGKGNDVLDGGEGFDYYRADYSDRSSGLTMTYDPTTGNGTITVGSEVDTLISVDGLYWDGGLIGTAFDDQMIGTASNDNGYYSGLRGGEGNDTIAGGLGDDKLLGEAGNDTLQGEEGNDELYGGDGDDLLEGADGNDFLDAGDGNDLLQGGGGDDSLFDGKGNDVLDGGEGVDYYRADYSDRTSGLTMTYDPTTGNGTITVGSEVDTLISIESFDAFLSSFIGTAFDDVIVGTSSSEGWGLSGREGNDTISGGAGDDNLYGEQGNDVLNGVESNAVIPGLGERDRLVGGEGLDRFILGDAYGVYYDDRDSTTNGLNDYATIADFNSQEDVIQLYGAASNYRLGANPEGTSLYLDKPGNEPDELIAILENVYDWIENPFNNHFYKLINVSSWQEAENLATVENAHLVSINDQNEQEWLVQTFGSSQLYWIGLTDQETEGVWQWTSGDLLSYTNWNVGEPSNSWGSGENYAAMNWGENGSWNDFGVDSPEWYGVGGAIIESSENKPGLSLNSPNFSYISPDPQSSQIQFISGSFRLNEDGTGVAPIIVTRSGLGQGNASVTVTLRDGTATELADYNPAPIVVNFADGEFSKAIDIPVVDDSIMERAESIQLILTDATGGAIGRQNTATVTIADNDATLLISGFPQGALGSNKGQATIVIAGQEFLPDDQISLIAPNGTEKLASKVYWVSDTEVWATFDLQGLSPGEYDVQVANGQNSAIAEDAFTVTNEAIGSLQVSLSYPALGFATVTYTNGGATDLIAPLLRIVPTNAQVSYPEEATTSATLRQLFNLSLGTSSNGPVGILAPGESSQFSFAYTPSGDGLISFAVEVVDPNEVINWDAIKSEARADYSFIDQAGWDAIWSNLTATLGTTVGQFQAVMAENANYLSQLGQPTNDLTRLFALEWKQAANTLTNYELISTTDIIDSAPGLSLTFGRTFHQSIGERYQLGSLGRGWSSEWDLRATTNAQGDIIIRSVGDFQRVFEQQEDGTYLETGGATITTVNGENRLREADGKVWVFGGNGELSAVEESNGNRISLQYVNNRLTQLTHSNGDSLTLAYNAQGRISQITDSTGQTVTYSYDATGETLLGVTTPQGTTSYSYDASDIAAKKYSLLSVSSELGYQRSFEYDNQGRLIQESSNGDTQTLTYSYDAVGGVTVTDGARAVRTTLLDDRGNVGQFRDVRDRNYLYRYDADGNLVGVTQPDGGQYVYGYDASGNLVQQTDPLGQTVTFSYDSTFNRLTGFTDAKGNGVAYRYDTQGNLDRITYGDGSFQRFTVDDLGNVTSVVNRRGSEIEYTYNASGLLTKKQFADGSSVTYGWDGEGNLTSVVDGKGTIAMQYDAANQLTAISYPNGRSLQFSYNADGQRTQMVSQDGYTVNYSYDAVGRLKTLTDGAGQSIITYDYDAAGRLSQETNGNGTYTTYEYCSCGQPNHIINYNANGSINSRFDYTYDELGRRTSMTTLEGTFQYGYDATGQLTSVITPDNRTLTYVYDAAGNRIGVTDNGATTTYTTNNLNQYTSVGNAVYTYDTDGNLISKTQGGQTTTYSYDVENRLVQVVNAEGTWQYEYDGLGNRIATVFNGQRTEYLLDPFGLGDVVGEYNGNTLVANYTHGIGLVSRISGANQNYYDADALGSTVGLTGTEGTYVNRYSYLPFGEDLTKVEGVANPFEYVGQWGVMDEGNGLDFMRARFYDSGLGRFTSVDPLGIDAGDINFYTYVFNNSSSLNDPSGKIVPLILGSLGGAIVGGAAAAYRAYRTYKSISYIAAAARGGAAGGAIVGLLGGQLQYGFGLPFNPTSGRGMIFTSLALNPTGIAPDPEPSNTGTGGTQPQPPQPPEPPCYSGAFEIAVYDYRPPCPPPSEPPNLPNGGSNGDPHLQTFDGINYDFQAVGEFTLIKSTTDDLEIQTRQEPWLGSTSVSVNTAVAIKLGGQRIGFYLNDTNPLKINGTATDLPNGSLYALGQNLIIRDGNTYNIFSANNDLIQISFNDSFINIAFGLAENRQGEIVGLLGNFNNNPNDDFALRNGTILGDSISSEQLYGTYGNSWRITQETSLFDYSTTSTNGDSLRALSLASTPSESTDTFTDLNFPYTIITIDTLTPEQRATAEAIARNAGITDPEILENAILDIALTNAAPEFIQGYVNQQRQATLNGDNTLINPDGVGIDHSLTASAVIPYTIRFANNAEAGTTPVAQVTITQLLDADLDLSTFTLSDFGFGNTTIDIPTGTQNFSQRLDLRTTQGVFVDVNAGLDQSSRVVSWTFTAIDPTTGQPANSAAQGFLPPNDANNAGQGFVGYSIQPLANLANNTRIDAQASITFNSQTPIQTPAVFNTLDNDLPTSQVNALPANSGSTFTVSWTGSDEGSGIASYDIYVATDGGQFTLWKDNTTETFATYTGQLGNTYAFYSVATDNLGRVEAAPATADTQTTLTTINTGPTLSAINDQATNEDVAKAIGFTIGDAETPSTSLTVTAASSNATLIPEANLVFSGTGSDRTLTITPAANQSGTATITLTVSDGELTTQQQFTLTVNPVNDTPIARNDAATTTTATPVNINVLNNDEDPENDALILSLGTLPQNGTAQINDNGTPDDQRDDLITYTPTAGFIGTDTFSYRVSDGNGEETTAQVNVTVNPGQSLTQAGNVLKWNGNPDQLKLKASLSSKQSKPFVINEIGVFVVEDEQGRINGLLPGAPGYVQAALEKAQVIFSALPDNFIANPTRILEGFEGNLLSFYLIQNGTTDATLNNPSLSNKVLFGTPLNGQATEVLNIQALGTNQFSLAFDDQLGDQNPDLTILIEVTDETVPIGSELQGEREQEIVDLTQFLGQKITTTIPIVASEAAYNNTVGFYRIENTTGTVLDPLTGQQINPGEAGYAQAAIRNSQTYGMSFTQQDSGIADTWDGGFLFAPFLIANGSVAQVLSANSQIPSVYFAFTGANPDKVDHIRLLGDNTWGFKDLPGGGDLDFNDIVMSAQFTVV